MASLLPPRVLILAVVCAFGLACDRAVEPFDPNETVSPPDLEGIFPPGAEQAPQDGAPVLADGGRGAPRVTGGAPPGAGGAGADAAPIQGRILVADELADRIPEGAVLFLIARNPAGGPPVAVQRVASPSFPMEFSIGPDDRMIQAIPFAGPLTLQARLDGDRDAMTRGAGDLAGRAADEVAPGDSDVRIVIDEVEAGT